MPNFAMAERLWKRGMCSLGFLFVLAGLLQTAVEIHFEQDALRVQGSIVGMQASHCKEEGREADTCYIPIIAFTTQTNQSARFLVDGDGHPTRSSET